MNSFPSNLLIDGTEYRIITSYRAVFQWMSLIDNPYCNEYDKIFGAIFIFFKWEIPDNIESALNELNKFIMCNKDYYSTGDNQKSYDFEQDYLEIWSAFMSKYGIDLNKDLTMHWWEFKARFDDLPSDSKIKEIINIRQMKIPDASNMEYRQSVIMAKKTYELK